MEEKTELFFEVLSCNIDWEIDYESMIFGCKAKIKVRIDNKIKLGYSTSKDGQIYAFDMALKNILQEFYPEISKIKVTDYKAEIIEKEKRKGTASYIKVKIEVEVENMEEKIVTEAVGADLVAVSIEALSQAYNISLQKIFSRTQTVIV
jgi:2-isopropylmalate synthase